MKCKSGDLAVITRPDKKHIQFLGRVIRVTRVQQHRGRWCWEYEGPLMEVCLPQGVSYVLGWYDDELTPVRPGDINPEEVRDLYLPKLPEVA